MKPEIVDNALAYIEANPLLHDQCTWARKVPCGTVLCLAGVIVTQAGYELIFNERAASTCYCQHPEFTGMNTIYEIARRVAGLSWRQADVLFIESTGCNLSQLRERWEAVKVGKLGGPRIVDSERNNRVGTGD